jgi:iron complex transport system substrate-binding protein
MKINSIPIAWNATPNYPTACAVKGTTRAAWRVVLVAQALLPVLGLDKKRTGRSACATCFLLLCVSLHAAQGAGATHTFTDEVGRRVEIPQEVDRVVSLAPNLTEMVFALGEGNRLAGDTDFCDYPAEATQKPHVGGPVNPNMEEIVSLKPDLVLATKSINRRETVNALERIGVPVYVTDPHNVEEMIASVEHVGSALGMEKSAGALVGDLRGRLSALDRRLAGSEMRRVLFVVWTDPLISVGRDTFIADALRRAGGRSVVDTKVEWPHVSLEEIVRLQPEVLVFASAHAGETQHDIDGLLTRPGWKNLQAIQRGNIVVISDAINRPAPRMVDAIEHLARALHPQAFAASAAPFENGGADVTLRGFLPASTDPYRLKPVLPYSTSVIEEACACGR